MKSLFKMKSSSVLCCNFYFHWYFDVGRQNEQNIEGYNIENKKKTNRIKKNKQKKNQT